MTGLQWVLVVVIIVVTFYLGYLFGSGPRTPKPKPFVHTHVWGPWGKTYAQPWMTDGKVTGQSLAQTRNCIDCNEEQRRKVWGH